MKQKIEINSFFAAAFIVFLSVCPLHAEVSANEEKPCHIAENQVKLYECLTDWHETTEAELAGAHQNLLTGYRQNEPPLAVLFEQEHDQWIRWRDMKCKVDTYYSRGGSAFENYLLRCLSGMNQRRISVINEMAASP